MVVRRKRIVQSIHCRMLIKRTSKGIYRIYPFFSRYKKIAKIEKVFYVFFMCVSHFCNLKSFLKNDKDIISANPINFDLKAIAKIR